MNQFKIKPSNLGKLIDPNFIFGPHLKSVEEHILNLYSSDEFNNLSIQLPIRHSKTLFSCITAFWILVHYPDERIVIAAFSKPAAKEMLIKIRDALILYGKELNNVEIDPNNCRSDYFKIKNRLGEVRAVGIGSKFSHATANTILCDDVYTEESARSPVQRKSIEDWFFNTLLNRRTKSRRGNAKIITTMTPRHPEDVLAVIEQQNKDNIKLGKKAEWVIHRQPAIIDNKPIFPQLWPIELLLQKRQELEDVGKLYNWYTVWMCDASNDPTAIAYPKHYFDEIFDYEPIGKPLYKFGAVDVAQGRNETGDYSAAVYLELYEDGVCYIPDSLMNRQPIPEFEISCAEYYYLYEPDCILIETNIESGFPTHLAEIAWKNYHRHLYINVIHHAGMNKEERIRKYISTLLFQKKLKFKDTPNNKLIVDQMRSLFGGAYDDGPDCVAMALEMKQSFMNEI